MSAEDCGTVPESPPTEAGAKWLLQYVPGDECFAVLMHHGKISQTIGHTRNGKYCLSPEEGVYMIEAGRAVHSGQEQQGSKLVQDIILQGLSTDAVLRCHAKLRRGGYIISSSSPKSAAASAPTPASVHQRLYAPNEKFRKSDPPPPKGLLVYARPEDAVLGTISDDPDAVHYVAVSEVGSQLFVRTQWTDMDPRRQHHLESFSFAKQEHTT